VVTIRPPHGGVEVIYVDSSSTDNSVKDAARSGATRVISVTPERPSAAIGRNAGWRAARAKIVLFLDGDTILDPDFVADSIGQFDDPNVAVVFGNRREIAPRSSIYNRVLALEWIEPAGPVYFCGGDALMRREVLERVGGYDDHVIAGEDTELCGRIGALGFEVRHVDRPMTRHDFAITRFSQYWRRMVRAGHAFAEVSERPHSAGSPLSREEARRKVKHGVALAGLLIGSPVISVILRSLWPILMVILLIVVLSVRTAIRYRWKSPEWTTLLLFGLNSHLSKIPVLWGQIRYRYLRRRGKREALIEYKDVPAVAVDSLTPVPDTGPGETSPAREARSG
jgi:cellulose synthase/poly-beta-1,6-N-acetylglucosamine synthase-like glycosyltransferase